jgi:hypothetical protein
MYPRIEKAKSFNPLIRVEKEQNERKCLQAVFEKRTKERIVDLRPWTWKLSLRFVFSLTYAKRCDLIHKRR